MGVLLECAKNCLVNRGRYVVAQRAEWPGRFRHQLRDHRTRRGVRDGRFAGKHLVGHGAERVDVASRSEVAFAGRLLGAHVLHRPDRQPGSCHARLGGATEGEGDAEVGQERLSILDEDVLGLDVAVKNALAMSDIQRSRDLAHEMHRLAHRELLVTRESFAQRLTAHQRHYVKERTARIA